MFPSEYFSGRYWASRFFGRPVFDVDCPPIVRVQDGRQGIGVVQPPSGTDYPLVTPSADVRYLLADFCLTYAGTFRPPFKIGWLAGFGCLPATDTGEYTYTIPSAPISPRGDLLVVDADNNVVFDSTAGAWLRRDWGDRLAIHTWQTNTAVCQLVEHTAWPTTNAVGAQITPAAVNYPSAFVPADAILDARAVFHRPKTVTGLGVLSELLSRTQVEFAAGYNMLITTTTKTVGRRRVTQIVFSATPGDGLGVYPGCEPGPLDILTINGIGPNAAGKFNLSAGDCYFVRQPVELVSTSPRRTLPWMAQSPYDDPDDNLPAPDAGKTKTAGWPHDDDPKYAHLLMGNDCPPNCDDAQYLATADYMHELQQSYSAIGHVATQSLTDYNSTVTRWNTAKTCMAAKSLQVVVRAQACPYLDVLVQICNTTPACMLDANVSIAISGGGTATVFPGRTLIVGASQLPGYTNAPATSPYTLGGSWPTFTAHWDSIPIGGMAQVSFRLTYAACGMSGMTPLSPTATASGTYTGGTLAPAAASTTLQCPGSCT